MILQDKGFLLSMNKYNENSVIAEFFTENHGKISGLIFGATSKKIKNYLLIGNKFHLNFNSNQEGKISYFKVEIEKIHTPIYMDNQKKLFCIICAMNLIKILTVINQSNIKIFNLIESFFKILNNENWLINFIFWELTFYKNIGYDIDFASYVENIKVDGRDKYIVESTKKIIPNFLINKNNKPHDINEIFKAYKIVGDFLDKTILKPNNITYPVSRIEFVNLIK